MYNNYNLSSIPTHNYNIIAVTLPGDIHKNTSYTAHYYNRFSAQTVRYDLIINV